MPINFNLEKYKNEIFVETGTYLGDSITKALSAGFQKIYSIEIDKNLYNNAKEKFKNDSRVNLIFGDSQYALKSILKKINKPTTFWLDAHIQPEQLDKIFYEKLSPLMEELELILSHPIKNHIIMIDDIRIIKSKISWGKSITINSLINFIKSKNSNFTLLYENGFVSNDVMVINFNI